MSVQYFKTNTLLKNLIGKDLINDDNIAIVELVKNSCDANASDIQVRFYNSINEQDAKLIISDNGSGMGESDVQDKWLNIAYSEKTTIGGDRKNFLAGNKGIGRFSCDRLGERLDMFTRKKGGPLLHLRVNWADFEQDGDKDKTIQQVKIYLDKIRDSEAEKLIGGKMPTKGTVLVVTKLRSVWGREKILSLKRSLEKFVSPNQPFLASGFSISIFADEYREADLQHSYHDKISGKVENTIFDQLKFKATYIDTHIPSTGDYVTTKLVHEGNVVYELIEEIGSFKGLKEIRIVIYYLNPYKKSYFKRQTGMRLIDFGSIFLFLNGFRVSPYGERGDDWLSLDNRKAQRQQAYLGTRDIVGRIEISDSGDSFKPVSSREGLKGTKEFDLLKDVFYLSVHRRLERFVVEGLNWDSVPSVIRAELRTEEGLNWEDTIENYVESWDRKRSRISSSILPLIGTSKSKAKKLWLNQDLLEGLLSEKAAKVESVLLELEGFSEEVIDRKLARTLKDFRKILDEKQEKVLIGEKKIAKLTMKAEEQKHEIGKLKVTAKQYEAQTLFLKSISTTDESRLLGYHHQICLDTTIIDNYIARTIKSVQRKDSIENTLKHIAKIGKTNKKIMAIAQFATKANFKSAVKKELTDIPAYFQQYLENVASDFLASGLKLVVENVTSKPFKILARRLELSIIIDNLVSNADKAHAKRLKVTMKEFEKNRLLVQFSDDGKGIGKSIDPKTLFELGVTYTSGSGLGLFHVKEIVDSLEASVEFVRQSRGTCVEMVFQR